MKHITDETPTELRCVERSVFMKEVNTQNLWSFELGTQEGVNGPIWETVGFQQRERPSSQNLAFDAFCKPSVTNAQCIIGTEKRSDTAIFLNYDIEVYNQGYGLIKEAFKALTKVDILE